MVRRKDSERPPPLAYLIFGLLAGAFLLWRWSPVGGRTIAAGVVAIVAMWILSAHVTEPLLRLLRNTRERRGASSARVLIALSARQSQVASNVDGMFLNDGRTVAAVPFGDNVRGSWDFVFCDMASLRDVIDLQVRRIIVLRPADATVGDVSRSAEFRRNARSSSKAEVVGIADFAQLPDALGIDRFRIPYRVERLRHIAAAVVAAGVVVIVAAILMLFLLS